MKAFSLFILCIMLFCGNVKSQQIDIRLELDEIQLANRKIQKLGSMDSKSFSYMQQIEKQKDEGSSQDKFNLIAVEESFELKPDLALFQQVEIANIVWRTQRKYSPESLLQQVGDINFINFIQRGDFSRFILGK